MARFTWGSPTQVKNALPPSDTNDLATKGYVDAHSSGAQFIQLGTAINSNLSTNSAVAVGGTTFTMLGDVTTFFSANLYIEFFSADTGYYIVQTSTFDEPSNLTTVTFSPSARVAISAETPIYIYRTTITPLNFLNINGNVEEVVNATTGLADIKIPYPFIDGNYIPDGTTFGTFGQLLFSSVNSTFYGCLSPNGTTSNFTWTKISTLNLVGTTVPGTTTVGSKGQLYFDTLNDTLYICDSDTSPYNWLQVSGSGGGGSGVFGSTSWNTSNFTSYSTAQQPSRYVSSDQSSTCFVMPFNSSGNVSSENTGEGTINGTTYITQGTNQQAGNGFTFRFPQTLTSKSDIWFNLYVTNLTISVTTSGSGGVTDPSRIFFLPMLASQANINNNLDPTYHAIGFFNGNEQNQETFRWLQAPTITISGTAPNQVIKISNGIATCKGDFEQSTYTGDNTDYLLGVVIGTEEVGKSIDAVSSIDITKESTSTFAYSLDMHIGLQGTGGGSGGSGIQGLSSPNNTIAIGGTNTNTTLDLAQQSATPGQVLAWNGTKYSPFSLPTIVNSLKANTGTARTGAITLLNGTNLTIVDNNDGTFTLNATGGSGGNPLGLISGTSAPQSTQGNNGDLYLQYNTSGGLFSIFQKVGGTWTNSNFFNDIAKNNAFQLQKNISLSDLADVNLYPNFNENTSVGGILNSSATTTKLDYASLFITVTRTGLSNTDAATLTSNIIVGRPIEADGNGAVVATWQFLVNSITQTGGTDNRTITIIGNIEGNDTDSIGALNAVSGAVKTYDTWSYTGGGLYANVYLPNITDKVLMLNSTNQVGLSYYPVPIAYGQSGGSPVLQTRRILLDDSRFTASQNANNDTLLGVNVGKSSGTNPTTGTIGSVGETYYNTTTGNLFVCTAINTSTNPFQYTWSQDKPNEVINHLNAFYVGSTGYLPSSSSTDTISATGTLTASRFTFDTNTATATFLSTKVGKIVIARNLYGLGSVIGTVYVANSVYSLANCSLSSFTGDDNAFPTTASVNVKITLCNTLENIVVGLNNASQDYNVESILFDDTQFGLQILDNTDGTQSGVVSFVGSASANNVRTFRTSADSAGGQITVPFNTAVTSIGTNFLTNAAGVFTFTRAVTCQVNITINCNANPDGWGVINGAWTTGTRYNQASTSANKFSVTQIITFASGDTYQWRPNNGVTILGNGGTNSFIEFIALN